MSRKKRSGRYLWILVIISIAGLAGVYQVYKGLYAPNVNLSKGEDAYLYIRSDDTYESAMRSIRETGFIRNYNTFEMVARRKGLDQKIKPGKYRLERGMSNNEIINMLRAGRQVPVRVTLNLEQHMPEIAGKISRYLEADSLSLIRALNDPDTAAFFGFKPETFVAMFVPNTYEFFWATPSHKVLRRFADEYKKFWNGERRQKAAAMDMDPVEVTTLASIVMKETNKMAESKRIAGVYVNRLRMGMPLQADPTLKFAANNFKITRVLNEHKEIDSPYNTYLYKGLPPGPICMASGPFIDAVLNYEKHDYLYFCAREDFSGFSNFAESYSQHQVNARRYQQALNERGILK